MPVFQAPVTLYRIRVKASDILRENVRKARLFSGLTQEDVAELAGMDFQHYQDIEAGRRPDLLISTVERLAKTLGVEFWMLFRPDAMPEPQRKRGRRLRKVER